MIMQKILFYFSLALVLTFTSCSKNLFTAQKYAHLNKVEHHEVASMKSSASEKKGGLKIEKPVYSATTVVVDRPSKKVNKAPYIARKVAAISESNYETATIVATKSYSKLIEDESHSLKENENSNALIYFLFTLGILFLLLALLFAASNLGLVLMLLGDALLLSSPIVAFAQKKQKLARTMLLLALLLGIVLSISVLILNIAAALEGTFGGWGWLFS